MRTEQAGGANPTESRSPGPAALVAEGLGVFALVLAGCGSIALGFEPIVTALVFGATVGATVYALGPVSGAHLNPAVTLGLGAAGRLPRRRIPAYATAQIIGATAAAAALRLAGSPNGRLGVTHPSGSDAQAFVWEAVLTFLLMTVIVWVTSDPRVTRPAAAAAIGGAVFFDALVGGPVSGASMNPARSLGPALVAGNLAGLWIYLSAPLLGAATAVWVSALASRDRGRSSDTRVAPPEPVP